MKLEFKKIVGHLPYGLKILNPENYRFNGMKTDAKTLIVNGFKDDYISFEGIPSFYPLEVFKPILHPLSEYCGKVIAKDVMSKLNCDLQTVYEIWALEDGSISLDKISYKTYIVLCKNLIDFNNLIENNLAININEI